ncbi:hypothetical protein ARHIZOSPH14_03260 [Agromyces rhizosphaerae]|uniref:Glycosyltransferase 2-like domain-containing protein n=1 Tax=Agromyces rhizosphaerae TaxID=88374 RepID=A0A9W6FMN8_9MICO|nr:glycosyltransferase [Agromyces rhizosphaerae]GLI26084.1 hypothetical protein ARHIZOSPH14_03260 [Agromyces rhizosphaerae]
MPSVSVALCTRDGAAHVAEQLDSIARQAVGQVDWVVSDDDSRDRTIAIVAEVARGLEHEVRILRNDPPLGVTANFEQALAATTGDLIALSDQDDVWHPEKLARMVAEFDKRPGLLLLASDARLVDGAGEPTGELLLDTIYLGAADRARIHDGDTWVVQLRRNVLTGATMLLRRELLELARPFPSSWVHDEWLATIAAAVGEVDVLEEPLIDYRQHGGNQIGAESLGWAGRMRRLREPRDARNARLLARAEALAGRLPEVPGIAPERVAEAADKLAHERVRSALPAARWRRVAPVVREWRTGRYGRFGLGAQDILRDLVQPVG